MRKYLGSSEYAPTMVANGSKRHPLQSHYRRIHKNPSEDDFGGILGGSETEETTREEIMEAAPKRGRGRPANPNTVKKAPKGTGRGRKAYTPSRKAAAEAEREARGPSAYLSTKKQLNKTLADLLKLASSKGGTHEAGLTAEQKTKRKEAADKRKQAMKDLKKELSEAKKAVRAKTHLPALRIQPVFEKAAKAAVKAAVAEHVAAVAPKAKAGRTKKAKTALVMNPKGRTPMTPSAKAAAAATRKANTHQVGPYKISLLKNPLTDFEIGGVKVVPALAGATGAVALSQLIKNLGFYQTMQAGYMKQALPGVITIALGAAGLYYAEKNKNSGMLKDLATDLTTFGMFVTLNDVVGGQINEMVNGLKKPAPAAATAGMFHGGAHMPSMNGGGWAGQEVPQMNGYHMSGGESGYPPAFALTGGEGYFVPPGLQLNGYHMSGDANSASTAAAITALNGRGHLNGGAFREQAIGGIDLDGYQD